MKNTNTKNTSLSVLWHRVGAEALGSRCWWKVALILGAGNSGANPSPVQVSSSSLPARIVPELPGAASGPCCTQTLHPFPPTSPLLPASRCAPSKTLHYQHSVNSKLRACLGHSPSQDGVPCPSSSLLSGFQGTKQDRRYSGSCSSAGVRTEGF